MKKINAVLSVFMLLCSIFVTYNFVGNVEAIGQHEVADGTTFGGIYSETNPEGTELNHFDTAGDGCDDLNDVCTDGGNIWAVHNELWQEPSDHDIVYKYSMDGTYISNWDYTANCGEYDARSITTDGTNIWVLDPAPVPYTSNYYDVHKFTMDGTYTGTNWSCTGANDHPTGITTDGNYIWILDATDDEVYKYSMTGTYTNDHWSLEEIVDEPFWYVLGITTDGEYFWITEYYDKEAYKFTMDGTYIGEHWGTDHGSPYGITTDGNYIWVADYTLNEVYNHSKTETFSITRTVYAQTEKNNCSFFPSFSNTNITLKIPVSTDVKGIVDVTNNTAGGLATEVNATDELVNDTFWYDSTNQFVLIRTTNLTTSSTVNWTVNCSYGVNFNLIIPPYLEVGQYFHSSGFIENSTGSAVSGMIATTRLLYSNGTDALPVNPKHNCTGGNYECTFSTAVLPPGIYDVSIEFTYPGSGIKFKEGGKLYLSFPTPDGVYSNAVVFFRFYNTNVGLGLIDETFKIYINGAHSYFDDRYYGYTGEIFDIEIKDYYNFTMYSGNYTITQTYQALNFGLTFHEYDFTNANYEYFYASFLKEGADRWYEKVVSSNGQKSFMLPSGNYTIRVYNADNSTYLSWSDTVNRSKAYLIGTSSVLLIIQGQSVIIGEFLELRVDLDYYFMPDIEIMCRNPPMIYSIYDKEGMAFGNDFYKICPALITIAITRTETYGNWINSTPMIPGNGSVLNGTVTILRDTLYLSGPGSITWVNITCADNDTLMQNTSYIPSRVDIYGQNLTINASGNISVMRETKYNQVRKFDWTYYPFAGYGPDPSRAGWHSAGIEFINPMAVPLYEVYGIAGFSNQTNSDGNSVVVRDTANGGVISKRGPDYDVTDAAIHFSLLSIDASSSRAFTIGYYKLSAESYTYDEGTVSIPTYDQVVWDSKSYNFFPLHWNNPYSTTFRGALYIKLNFDVPTDVDTESMRIWDVTNNHEIDPSLFIPGGKKYIRISAQAMGDVLPGASREFEVYFLMTEYPGADPEEFHLNTPIWQGMTLFLLIILAGCVCIVVGAFLAVMDKKEKRDRWKVCVALGVFIIVVINVMAAMGL